MKPVVFEGTSRTDLRDLDPSVRGQIGVQLDRVQRGLEPDDWKPMRSIGAGVREIWVRDESGIFRTIYIATFPEAVFVLHVLQKKSESTAASDIALASARLKKLKRTR